MIVCNTFRIAEGEQEPESCRPGHHEGWRVFDTERDWVVYYYRSQRKARAAAAAMNRGETPVGESRWWSRATVYLP